MSDCSRRDFIVRSAAGALALGSQGLLAKAMAAESPASMTIAKWAGAKQLSAQELKQAAIKLTEKAIEGLGGMKRFVGRGAVVWVKPNIGWDRTPELAANTNPDVVATVVRLCFEAGAKTVRVGDNPCDMAAKAYPASGIPDAVKKEGAEVLFLDKSRFRDTAIGGERVKSIPIFPAILEADLVINVPVVKHHRLAISTLCMKNYMGVIEKRNTFHQAIPECLVDLTRFMKPQICILDAVRILKANGPKGGNLKDVELTMTLAAGTDIIALDAWGAEVMYKKPSEVGAIVKGAEAGLGKIDYKAIAREIAVS
jgi:uncharacterized protein (DUF362 family)